MKKINNSWLYLPILILGINLIYRLIDQSQLLFYFPLGYGDDIVSYMAQLFFLDKCGFHNFCPYWYSGFIAFEFTPPAWFFFTWPLLKIFGDVKTASYVSLILILALGLVSYILLGKLFRFSRIKGVAFFLLFFGNAIAIGNFIRLGSIHQLFGWLNLTIMIFILLYYKDQNINKNFYWVIPFLAITILSHQTVAVLAPFVLLGLFLIKKGKERFKIIFAGLISLLITSFWWADYVKGFWKTAGADHILTKPLTSLNILKAPQDIIIFIIPLIFGVISYFYFKSYRKKREILFFLPILILSVMVFFRLVYFIPILKQVYSDSYLYLFIFFGIFMFMKLDLKQIKIMKFIPIILIVVSLISVGFNVFYTPKFTIPNETGNRMLDMLENVEGKFHIRGNVEEFNSKAIYAYASTYLNLSSSDGFYFVFSRDHWENFGKVHKGFEEKNCQKIIEGLEFMHTEEIISIEEGCKTLEMCGFNKKEEIENICLYYVD